MANQPIESGKPVQDALPRVHHAKRLLLALACAAILLPAAPPANANPCTVVGGCPVPVPEPAVPVYLAPSIVDGVAGQLGVPSVADGNGGPCTFEGSESSGLTYIKAIEPYGSVGWTSSDGDNIYQVLYGCETKKADTEGNKYVYWVVKDSLNARPGWHVRDTSECGPCDGHAETFKASPADDGSILDHTPENEISDNCNESHEFSLGASIEVVSATLSWTKQICHFHEAQDLFTGKEVQWHADVGDVGDGRSWSFSYGFVTRVPAGTPSIVTVHHEAQFCRYDCLFGDWNVYTGDYSVAFQTTTEPAPSPANGDFESGGSCPPTDWQYYEYNSGTDCTVSAPTHSGWGAVKIDDPSSSLAAGIASTCVPVSPGQSVTVSAWYSGGNSPSSSASFSLYLEFFDHASPGGSGTRIGVAWTGAAASSASWNQLAASGVAPSGTVCARALLYSSVGSSGAFYVDDVELSASG
ncbi:MAG: hypothetical protein QOI63_297 [Thermoplasmata archaeon]|jgi:hypothetical protein|nr:hypothetical protein [Thermoplasmata archaeon]